MLIKKIIYWAETIKIIIGCIDIQYLYQKRKKYIIRSKKITLFLDCSLFFCKKTKLFLNFALKFLYKEIK